MRREVGRRPHGTGATIGAELVIMRTVMTRRASGRRVFRGRHLLVMTARLRRRRLALTQRTLLVFTTFWVTFLSGFLTAGTRVIRAHRPTVGLGQPGVTVAGGFFAAAPGSTGRGSSVPPSAAGTSPTGGATTSGFVLPGPFSFCLLTSLPLGVQGA